MTWMEAVKELELHRYHKIDQGTVLHAYRKRTVETHPEFGGTAEAYKRVEDAMRLLSRLLWRGTTITRKSRKCEVVPRAAASCTRSVCTGRKQTTLVLSFVAVI